VADNDTRPELEARGEPLTLPDAPRSEGGPAQRVSEPAEEPETTRPPPSVAGEPVAVPTSGSAAGIDGARLDAGAPVEHAPAPHEPWHAAIADALTRPEPEPTESPSADTPASSPQPIERTSEPATDGVNGSAAPLDLAAKSFTEAAENLFRPPAAGPGEETHLITLGRRLDPSLRIPRPVPPVIEPQAEPEQAPAITWKTRLFTALHYAGIAVAAYLALVLVLIVLFRFVNPPGSMLMLTQLLTGTSIHRTWIPFEDISPALVRAVIVSEDGRFCEHGGIDTQAMRQAIERASGGTPRGASTISMQLTKNLFLFNAKSYLRKVVEIPLTLIMELLWPKRRILEVYLNVAEWGPGVFGAEAAARHHFGKPAASLDQREAALLAAVLPNPVQRVAGAPGPQTSRKARVIQSRVKAYGAVASCVVAPAASTPPAAKTPTLRKPQPLRTQPKKQRPQKKPADDWAPILNFGN
jgi:monofunctional biosynthetic peptidoglycan transglycosylase